MEFVAEVSGKDEVVALKETLQHGVDLGGRGAGIDFCVIGDVVKPSVGKGFEEFLFGAKVDGAHAGVAVSLFRSWV